jgi:hypothetical protein
MNANIAFGTSGNTNLASLALNPQQHHLQHNVQLQHLQEHCQFLLEQQLQRQQRQQQHATSANIMHQELLHSSFRMISSPPTPTHSEAGDGEARGSAVHGIHASSSLHARSGLEERDSEGTVCPAIIEMLRDPQTLDRASGSKNKKHKVKKSQSSNEKLDYSNVSTDQSTKFGLSAEQALKLTLASVSGADAASGSEGLGMDSREGDGGCGETSAGTRGSRKILKHFQACLPCSRSKKRCDGARPCSTCTQRGKGDECTNQKSWVYMYICPDTDDSAHLNAARKEVKLEEKKNPMIEVNGGGLQVHPGNASRRILPLQTQTSAHTERKGEGEGALQEEKGAARSATEAADAAEAASDTASRCAAECEAAHLAAKACVSPAATSAAPPTAAARAAAAAVYAAAAANAAMRAAAAAAEAAKAAAEAAASEALVQDAQNVSVERPLVFRANAVRRKSLCGAYSRSTDEDDIPILLKNMWENQGINATRVSVLVCVSTLCVYECLVCVCNMPCVDGTRNLLVYLPLKFPTFMACVFFQSFFKRDA